MTGGELASALAQRTLARLGARSEELRPHVESLAAASAAVIAKGLLGLDTTSDVRHLQARAASIKSAGAAEANRAMNATLTDVVALLTGAAASSL